VKSLHLNLTKFLIFFCLFCLFVCLELDTNEPELPEILLQTGVEVSQWMFLVFYTLVKGQKF